jgi:hypothetical protein
MKKALRRKCLVISVIAVFCSLSIIPTIGVLNPLELGKMQTKAYEWEDTGNYEEKPQEIIEVEVIEYRPDGSTETSTVSLKNSEVNAFKEKLLTKQTIEEQFSLLKEFHLIPSDVSPETLRAGMIKAAENIGITKERAQRITNQIQEKNELLPILPPISLSFFSYTYAAFIVGNSVRIGLSPIMMPFIRVFDNLLNKYLGFVPPAIDVTDMAWGLITAVMTEGPTGTHMLALFPGGMISAGFVGYAIKAVPLLVHAFYGFSVMTFTAGIGFHVYEP